LRIAWDNTSAGKDQAGTGTYASNLLKHLRARLGLGFEVFDGIERERENNVIKRQITTAKQLFWYHWHFPRSLRGKFDLFHGPAFFVPFRTPCPSVTTVLDLTPILFPHHFTFIARVYFRLALPYALKHASAIFCISEHSRQDLLKAYKVDPAKVHTVYPGVEHERFHPQVRLDRTWAESAGIKNKYVLHVGTLFYRKNVPVLLRAVARLRDAGSWGDRQLVLGGAEIRLLRGAEDIHATIDRLRLQDIVVLTGRVPSEHLPGLYAGAEVLVMPSIYEGFGFPVVEAMACGTPVICSNVSSLPEVAGEAALTFDPQDDAALAEHLGRVLADDALHAEMRRKGLEHAGTFRWERAAEQTEAIYRQVVGGRSPARDEMGAVSRRSAR
jgi:alpha-1,3-rhamnosyl/mannosyltransferase